MNIMIIDDQIQSLNSLKSALEVRGFNCFTFSDPLLAVSSYNSDVYDLVITDINMPEMNGLEVKEAILRNNPDALVILITGDSQFISNPPKLNLSEDLLFTKPIEHNKFFDTIQDLKAKYLNHNSQSKEENQAENSL